LRTSINTWSLIRRGVTTDKSWSMKGGLLSLTVPRIVISGIP